MSTVHFPKWNIKADYVETCNCDYGYLCNFNGFPTYGFCRALVPYRIKIGSYGSTKLDGIDVVYAGCWPKAIDEGNGTVQLFISKKATEDQRKGIVNICMGSARGEGPFVVFASRVKYKLEPQFVDIAVKIDGRKSSFTVPGVLDVQIEGFKNPVTGEEQDTKIQILEGFVWKVADAVKSKMMHILTPNFNFDDSSKNAFVSVIEYKGP
jgi:hypothetical protein